MSPLVTRRGTRQLLLKRLPCNPAGQTSSHFLCQVSTHPPGGTSVQRQKLLVICLPKMAGMYPCKDQATWLCSAATLRFMEVGGDLATVNFKAS